MTFEDEYAEEKRTQVRKVSVEKVSDRDIRYSGGFTLYLQTSPDTTQLIDLNLSEIREWGEYMIAFAKENENK